MMIDNTTARLLDILLSVATSQDKELQDRVLELIEDNKILLGEQELNLLDSYVRLANEVNTVPQQGTLVARNIDFQNGMIIQAEAILDYTKIFIHKKKNVKMTDIITSSISDYTSGNISFEKFGSKVQEGLVIGSPILVNKEEESNLDISFYEKLTEPSNQEEGIHFSIPCIDDKYRGLLPGDLLTIAGYTGSMKTTLAANMAYNGARLGKNTIYISLEVSKEDLTIALLSRHSMSSKCGSITRSDMKEYATKEKDKFITLSKEYNELPGKIKIIDEKNISTYSTTAFNEAIDLANKELEEKTGHKADIIVLDHIQLLKFNDSKASMNDPYQLVNYYTAYFREKAAREGYAVILVSQTSRQGYEYACKHNGQYLETGLAEANELERASTGIVTVFATDNSKNSNEITVQLLKNRFGERMQEPQQAPLMAAYFMVGTGVITKDVGPVFSDSAVDLSKFENMDLESILSGI